MRPPKFILIFSKKKLTFSLLRRFKKTKQHWLARNRIASVSRFTWTASCLYVEPHDLYFIIFSREEQLCIHTINPTTIPL